MSRKPLIISILSAGLILLVVLLVTLWRSDFGRDSREYGFRRAYQLRGLENVYSEKELGAILNHSEEVTTFRVFAPSASNVSLYIFEEALELDAVSDTAAVLRAKMSRDRDGVWEYNAEGVLVGANYCYLVERQHESGYVADPYARAVSSHQGTSIVIDPKSINRWFDGWREDEFEKSQVGDLMIYEVDIRNFTIHPSSGARPDWRGKFAGFSETRQAETGIYHLVRLGVNAVSLIGNKHIVSGGVVELSGLNAPYPFSLSSAYASDSQKGTQYYEFKQVVSDLHAEGIAVIVDLELPFVSDPQILAQIDAAYYLNTVESDADLPANRIRMDSPMYRRMVGEMVARWIMDYGVDGFRLLNASRYDVDFLKTLHDKADAIDPSTIFIADICPAERELAAEFRSMGWLTIEEGRFDDLLSFVAGAGHRDDLVGLFTDFYSPVYSEMSSGEVMSFSLRDKMTVADRLSSDPAQDGRNMSRLDLRRNIAAFALLGFYPGPIMIAEGQDFLHSRRGQTDARSLGDEINALRWNARTRAEARSSIAYLQGLISLRNSIAGSSIKNAATSSADDVEWILPEEDDVVGFIINRHGRVRGGRFVVIFNMGDSSRYVEIDFPSGLWRIIARSTSINAGGVPGTHRVRGSRVREELISPGSVVIFMSE